MTLSETTSATKKSSSNALAWYRPIFSPEHGVYVMLLVSFLLGAAAAQQWRMATTLAFVSAFAGFQAEHPLVLQIKQRRSWKLRFLLWGGIYASLSLSLAGWLSLQIPILLWLYLGTFAAFVIDAISVFYRKQRSVPNELLTFAAVCLAAPFAYISTVGSFTISIVGLWLLNTFFFSSAIFTVKLRKLKTASFVPGIVYHAIASLVVLGLWLAGWLAPMAALAFGVALFKFSIILVRQDWYRTTPIQNVAMLETFAALLFFIIAAISLLPAHL